MATQMESTGRLSPKQAVEMMAAINNILINPFKIAKAKIKEVSFIMLCFYFIFIILIYTTLCFVYSYWLFKLSFILLIGLLIFPPLDHVMEFCVCVCVLARTISISKPKEHTKCLLFMSFWSPPGQ